MADIVYVVRKKLFYVISLDIATIEILEIHSFE